MHNILRISQISFLLVKYKGGERSYGRIKASRLENVWFSKYHRRHKWKIVSHMIIPNVALRVLLLQNVTFIFFRLFVCSSVRFGVLFNFLFWHRCSTTQIPLTCNAFIWKFDSPLLRPFPPSTNKGHSKQEMWMFHQMSKNGNSFNNSSIWLFFRSSLSLCRLLAP